MITRIIRRILLLWRNKREKTVVNALLSERQRLVAIADEREEVFRRAMEVSVPSCLIQEIDRVMRIGQIDNKLLEIGYDEQHQDNKTGHKEKTDKQTNGEETTTEQAPCGPFRP